jgi:hypothetical protein
VSVAYSRYVQGDVPVIGEVRVPRLNSDLTAHADVATASAQPLRAAAGLSWQGYKLVGKGFVVNREEAETLLLAEPRHSEVLVPYLTGQDISGVPRRQYVIDFAMRSEEEAKGYPVLYDLVRDRVYPERQANRTEAYRTHWWRFGGYRREMREALAGLDRFIVTLEVSKHRLFTFVPNGTAPDGTLVVIASDDPFVLGVLSSATHQTWARAAGGMLEDKKRYNKAACFDAFPLPTPSSALRSRIAKLADAIELHRSSAIARNPRLGLTALHNVVERLRSGELLEPKETEVHRQGACGVLRDLHDELDAAVAEAYGWSWPEPTALILERLVALHDRRIEEEAVGTVRWLRPDYQRPRYGRADEAAAAAPTLGLPAETPVEKSLAAPVAATPWPADAIGQITVLRAMAAMTPVSIEEAVQRLMGAKRDIVGRHLETLAMLGEVRDVGGGRYAVAAGSL